jgi:hypothetical protein
VQALFVDNLTMPLAVLVFVAAVVTPASAWQEKSERPAVRGAEYASAVNLLQKNVKAEVKVFVPEAVKRIRAAWVIVAYALGGNGGCCYYDEAWRRFAESTNLAIVHARFSTISGTLRPSGAMRSSAAAMRC